MFVCFLRQEDLICSNLRWDKNKFETQHGSVWLTNLPNFNDLKKKRMSTKRIKTTTHSLPTTQTWKVDVSSRKVLMPPHPCTFEPTDPKSNPIMFGCILRASTFYCISSPLWHFTWQNDISISTVPTPLKKFPSANVQVCMMASTEEDAGCLPPLSRNVFTKAARSFEVSTALSLYCK